MKSIYLLCSLLITGCAVVDDVKLTQRPYQLPSGTTPTARIRVNTDALAFIYPRGCADATAPGSGVAVFQNNSDRLGTAKGNNRVLGMPAGTEEFNDSRFGTSELEIPAQKFVTLGYRYDNRATSSVTTCSGAFAFMPLANHDYESALYNDGNANRCVFAVRDMTANRRVDLTDVSRKSCATPTNTETTTASTVDVILTEKNTKLMIGLATEQGGFVQEINKLPKDTTVFSYVNFHWNNISDSDTEIKANTTKNIRVKWINNQGVAIKDFTRTIQLTRSPHWINNWFKSSELGIGSGKVEVYENDKLLAKSKFEVLDMTLEQFKLKYPAPAKP